MKNLTVLELGTLLAQEFARDDWGLVDPGDFYNPPRRDDSGEGAGLYEVLERVIKRLRVNA